MKAVLAILLSVAVWVGACAQNTPNVTKQSLAKLTKTRDAAQKALQKHPADAKLKQQFVAVNDKLADQTMMADFLTPHEKYAGALRDYRQSLKIQPKDAEARKWVDEIESIYRSMHRPIPK